ncbi:hypothetical protein CPB85DRAFT_1330806 [Mucidula mucida]|nr:hypothetical protein CPB85DRAFT_1330806 [Mucidula mucida]
MATLKRDVLAISVHSQWDFEPGTVWEKAPSEWQDFYQRWSAVDKDQVLKKETMTLLPQRIDPLLVRDSYEPLLHSVFCVAEIPSRGVLITGQPGIGKTLFLWYALIRLITLGQLVIFAQSDERFLFYNGTVYSAGANDRPALPVFRGDKVKPKPFIWTLIDADGGIVPPHLVHSPCFPVQASAPNPICYKQWMKQRCGARLSLPLWSRKELWQGLRLQHRYDQFRAEMTHYLPPSPANLPDAELHIYVHDFLCKHWNDGKKDNDIDNYMADSMDEGNDDENAESSDSDEDDGTAESGQVDQAAGGNESRDQELSKDIDHAFRLLLNDAIDKYGFVARDDAIEFATYHAPSFADRDNVFTMSPVPLSSDYTDFALDFKSTWVAEQVMRRMADAENDRLIDMYRHFKDYSQSSLLAGHCLKPIAFRLLTAHHTDDFLFVRMAGDPTQDAPIFKATLNRSSNKLPFSIHPGKSEYYDDNAIGSLKPGPLYIPNNDKNPLFDALWIDFAESDTSIVYTLWVFQVSKSIVYHGSARGYKRIRQVMSALTRSAAMLGKSAQVSTAEWQLPKGWTKNVFCWQIPIPAGPPPWR